jgi:hypothetical protein
MQVVAIVTLVIVAVLVAALAFYLSWVVVLLRNIDDTLGKVLFGVRAIAHRAEPIAPLVTRINDDLGGAAEVVAGLDERLARPTVGAR